MNAHQPVLVRNPDGVAHTAECAAADCPHLVLAGLRTDKEYERMFKEHTDQYEPGRAPDITVDWEVSALCSVCEDGIGDIEVDSDGDLACKECGTYWSITGDGGTRSEEN